MFRSPGMRPGKYSNPFFEISQQAGKEAKTATTAPATGGGRLPEEIHRQRQEAEKKAEKQYQETKATIDAAYEAGLMSNEEYQNLLTESRETIESQTADLMRRTTEGAYGQVNIVAWRGGLRGIETSRIGLLAKSRRDISFERTGRRTEAAKEKARGYADLMRTRQIPRFDIPEGFGRGEALTAITGQPSGYTSPTRVIGSGTRGSRGAPSGYSTSVGPSSSLRAKLTARSLKASQPYYKKIAR